MFPIPNVFGSLGALPSAGEPLTSGNSVLLENGDEVLLESGNKLLLE